MKTKELFDNDPRQVYEDELEELKFLIKVTQGKELKTLLKRYAAVEAILSGIKCN